MPRGEDEAGRVVPLPAAPHPRLQRLPHQPRPGAGHRAARGSCPGKSIHTSLKYFFTKFQIFLQHPSLSLATADSQYSLDCSETGLPPLTNTVSSSLSLVTVSDNLIVENDSCTYIKLSNHCMLEVYQKSVKRELFARLLFRL